MAEKRSMDLNPEEKKFARCLTEGECCVIGSGKLPEKAIESGKGANVVRGEIIRSLILIHIRDRENSILGGAIDLCGAWVSGTLDLSHENVPVSLSFGDCHFADEVRTLHMECHGLYMNGCCLAEGLNGYGMKTKGGVFLRRLPSTHRKQNPFSAKGNVDLMGAHIGGDLDCMGGEFDNPGGKALNADRITVKGNVRLSNGFSAKG